MGNPVERFYLLDVLQDSFNLAFAVISRVLDRFGVSSALTWSSQDIPE
jgi:hypothetical protein